MKHVHTYMTDLGEVILSDREAELIKMVDDSTKYGVPISRRSLDMFSSLMRDIKRVAEFKYGGTW